MTVTASSLWRLLWVTAVIKFSRNGIPQPVPAVPPPKVVAPRHHLAMQFGQLIFGKIIRIAATRGQMLRLKCTKFCFSLGSAPDPASPGTLAGFNVPTFQGGGREGKGRGGERRESEVRKCRVAPHT